MNNRVLFPIWGFQATIGDTAPFHPAMKIFPSNLFPGRRYFLFEKKQGGGVTPVFLYREWSNPERI